MFVIGVGNGLSNNRSQDRLRAISGTDAFTGLNIKQADYWLVQNFSDLDNALKTLTESLCDVKVKINKKVDNGSGYQNATGWKFEGDVSVSSGTYVWVSPATANGQKRNGVTDASGALEFDWRPNTVGATSSISIEEIAQPGYALDHVTCGPDNAPQTVTNGKFSLSNLAIQSVTECTVYNRKLKGSIELKKVWVGQPGSAQLKVGSSAGGSDVADKTVAANGTTDPKTVDTGPTT